MSRTARRPSRGVACLAVLLCASRGLPADDLDLGEYLAGECTTCHRADSVNQGIPNIFGLPRVVFVQAMEQYRDGSRINLAMRNVARSLGDEEIAALAAFLEQWSPFK